MSILIDSYHRLLTDLSQKCGMRLCAPPEYGLAWVLKEGPALDKELQQYIESGESPECDIAFPEWVKPLWTRFRVLHDPLDLKVLRQLLVFGYKAAYEPTQEQNLEAENAFIKTDAGVGDFADSAFQKALAERPQFWHYARAIVSRVIGDIQWQDIIPFHGPGAVFPSFDPSERSCFFEQYRTIDQMYPYYDYFESLPGFHPNAFTEVLVDTIPTPTIRCKMSCVPKDSRGPRTICVHPKESIYIQQGQRVKLEQAIMAKIGRFINLKDQSVNGKLALNSSLSKEYCTLDLKEASDRMSCELVEFLFGSAYQWLACSRAEEIQLISGRVLALRKFCPMGNALCFPVQSLVFFALVQAGIHCRAGNRAGSRRSAFADSLYPVYVFGDDIIAPSTYYEVAIESLEFAGLLVNKSKSFNRGSFRESCGVDAYNGINVTPLRMKVHQIESNTDLVAMSTFAKSLRLQGFEECSSYLYQHLRTYVKLH